MIIFLLAAIVTILLFGRAAVLGTLGTVGAFGLLVLALTGGVATLAWLTGVDFGDLLKYGCLALLALGLLGRAFGFGTKPN